MQEIEQIYFVKKLRLAYVIEKANEWVRKEKHRYKKVEFCLYDTLECAVIVDMRRDGYRIKVEDYNLVN